jgi:putative DNA primase/helicase
LDAGVERPELRRFNVNVIEEAHLHRGELAVAGLTVLRAWYVARAGGESVNITPLGGFEAWSQRVREALIWLGEADPCDTIEGVRANDPARDELSTVLLQWKAHLGALSPYTVQQVIERAINVPTFYTALMTVAATKSGTVSNERLGRWLKRVQGKIVDGLSLTQRGRAQGYPLWTLKG